MFDQKKAEEFSEKLVGVMNNGALCLMISIGHRTGLFDVMSKMEPATVGRISEQARLNERYVREWLGAMVTGGLIMYEPQGQTYYLPQEHAAFMTRAAGANNIAVFAQYFPILGSVEDDIVECFRNGGGVPYEKYPRFHDVMAEDSGQSVLSSLYDHILPLIPGLTERLERGIAVLDAGCGSGRIINMMAERFPQSSFTGYDLSKDAITVARKEAASKNLTNVKFEVRDLSHFYEEAEPEKFHFITTFDAVHDQARPMNLLKGIRRSLKADGVYLMQDIHASSHVEKNLDHPIGAMLYTVSCLHCMTVSLAQGGDGLGAVWGNEKAMELLNLAGFKSVEIHQLAHDIQNDYYVIR